MRIIIKPMGAVVISLSVVALGSMAGGRLRGVAAARSGDAAAHASVITSAPAPNAQVAPAAPAGTTDVAEGALVSPILPTALQTWQLDALAPAAATKSLVADNFAPNVEKHALHVHISQIVPDCAWNIQIKHSVPGEVAANAPLVMRFIARSPSSNPIHAVFLLNSGDYQKDLDAAITLTPNWKTYVLPFRTNRSYAPNAAAAILHLGSKPGDVELAALQVYHAEQPS
jgi:hypothetical protein